MPDFNERLRNANNSRKESEKAYAEEYWRNAREQEERQKREKRVNERMMEQQKKDTISFGREFHKSIGTERLLSQFNNLVVNKGKFLLGKGKVMHTEGEQHIINREPESGVPVEVWFDVPYFWYTNSYGVGNTSSYIRITLKTNDYNNREDLLQNYRFESFYAGRELINFPSEYNAYRRSLAESLTSRNVSQYKSQVESYLESLARTGSF